MNSRIVIFNVLSLVITLGLCVLLFQMTAMSDEAVQAAKVPLSAEEFEDVDLGEDYGPMSVIELMGYYMENPPQPPEAGQVEQKQHFGGC